MNKRRYDYCWMKVDNALKTNDIIDAQVASALIGTGDENIQLISEELSH